ncbi:MAG: 3'-5' exonuclease [Paludibacteraceae bacterium]
MTAAPENFKGISHHFTVEENRLLDEIRYASLYELTETIIDVFKLADWNNEAVFLQSFQDVVFKFVSSKNGDLSSFLKWWNKKGSKQTISTPENQQALRVMTIHKSKGLDFKVVIIPFCNWWLDAAKNRSLMWLQTTEEPFNELPLIPINFTSKLGNSIFAEQYYNELLHQYVDSLNMAYVAFTRSRHELICFTPLPKEKKANSKKWDMEQLTSLSDMLYKYVELKSLEEGGLEQDDSGSLYYELGNSPVVVNDKLTDEKEVVNLVDYPILQINNRLKIKSLSLDEWKIDKTIAENPLNFGVIMHELMQRLSHPNEDESLIRELIFAGKINQQESEIIRQTLTNFWKLPQIETWFYAEGKVLNEATILMPDGGHYRPDRVIINGRKAIITDYKFGIEKRAGHRQQIARYGDILCQMNYETEMYLVYVMLSEVLNV